MWVKLKATSGQYIPGDCVSDGCEDPVELTEGGASVVEPARDPAPHTTQMALFQPRLPHVTADSMLSSTTTKYLK